MVCSGNDSLSLCLSIQFFSSPPTHLQLSHTVRWWIVFGNTASPQYHQRNPHLKRHLNLARRYCHMWGYDVLNFPHNNLICPHLTQVHHALTTGGWSSNILQLGTFFCSFTVAEIIKKQSVRWCEQTKTNLPQEKTAEWKLFHQLTNFVNQVIDLL